MSSVLTQSELSTGIAKEYQFERDELRNKFIEYKITADMINMIFDKLDERNRIISITDLVKIFRDLNISEAEIVGFLKSLGMEDAIVTRVIRKAV
jgi:hypothetical protein